MQSFLAVEKKRSLLLLLNDGLLSSSDETGSSGGDKTTFLSSGGVSSHGSGMTNVLMVTTTMGMFDGVHSDTSNSGPVLLLCLGLVLFTQLVIKF